MEFGPYRRRRGDMFETVILEAMSGGGANVLIRWDAANLRRRFRYDNDPIDRRHWSTDVPPSNRSLCHRTNWQRLLCPQTRNNDRNTTSGDNTLDTAYVSVFMHPSIMQIGRRHYVFGLSVHLCVRTFVGARAKVFSDRLAGRRILVSVFANEVSIGCKRTLSTEKNGHLAV